MGKRVERTRAGNTWTEARYRSFIMNVIRAGSQKWPPKWQVKNEGREKRKNPATGKLKYANTCNKCKKWFWLDELEIDHIKNIRSELDSTTTETFFDTIGTAIKLAYCEKDNLQRLCKNCHRNIKTKEDREVQREFKSIKKMYPYEESSYRNMISRCNNPNSTGYKYYGGRGIKICKEWEDSFYNFYRDMGPRPDRCSLDRIDVEGDYNKDNCRWASFKEQARNKRGNTEVTYKGDTKLICEWAEELGIKENTITYRLLRGWSVAEALEFQSRDKKIYNGRLSDGDLEFIKDELEKGVSQVKIGKILGMDSSQISRICKKFNFKKPSKEEKR